jgi:hypothetical protein
MLTSDTTWGRNKSRTACNFVVTGQRAGLISGQVAQSVEQWTENPRVGGSIPSLTTSSRRNRRFRCVQLPLSVISTQWQLSVISDRWPAKKNSYSIDYIRPKNGSSASALALSCCLIFLTSRRKCDMTTPKNSDNKSVRRCKQMQFERINA